MTRTACAFLVCQPVARSMSFGQHMRLRWWQRGKRDNPNLNIAWEEAIEVDIHGRVFCDARYHKESGTLLVRKTGGGGTVIEGRCDTIVHNGVVRCAGCFAEKSEDKPCRACNDMASGSE